jgi:hypothetical protein
MLTGSVSILAGALLSISLDQRPVLGERREVYPIPIFIGIGEFQMLTTSVRQHPGGATQVERSESLPTFFKKAPRILWNFRIPASLRQSWLAGRQLLPNFFKKNPFPTSKSFSIPVTPFRTPDTTTQKEIDSVSAHHLP